MASEAKKAKGLYGGLQYIIEEKEFNGATCPSANPTLTITKRTICKYHNFTEEFLQLLHDEYGLEKVHGKELFPVKNSFQMHWTCARCKTRFSNRDTDLKSHILVSKSSFHQHVDDIKMGWYVYILFYSII